MTSDPIRLGVIGLGRAFLLTLPAFQSDSRIKLVAACAPRIESRTAFEDAFGGKTYEDISSICADEAVEAIYVATPHQMHAAHVIAAAKSGKHVLVDKPLAISMEDGDAMIAACAQSGVHLIVGPSHSFDTPVQQARALIDSGELGSVRMIHAHNYTDFLYRPRRPEELRTDEGGGVIFSQAIHQIDIVRLLAGGMGRQVMAMTGNWDPDRPTEGAYSMLLNFENGVFASLTYSGYAHYDSDEAMNWVGELGHDKDPELYGVARKALETVMSPEAEAAQKQTRTFGSAQELAPAAHHEHFGPITIFCDHGDIRLTPDGIWIYGNKERRFITAPEMASPRTTVIDALYNALRTNTPPVQTGKWGLASLEVCHAILASAESGNPVQLTRQIDISGREQAS
ncbi:MAG: Gfo/Idh/MocA family oxidoreductase [Rhizobiales bacterium]|nr:Gfo/Idh/MocA family oxidoreductase [Hyphomicrobiales bacterium]